MSRLLLLLLLIIIPLLLFITTRLMFVVISLFLLLLLTAAAVAVAVAEDYSLDTLAELVGQKDLDEAGALSFCSLSLQLWQVEPLI